MPNFADPEVKSDGIFAERWIKYLEQRLKDDQQSDYNLKSKTGALEKIVERLYPSVQKKRKIPIAL